MIPLDKQAHFFSGAFVFFTIAPWDSFLAAGVCIAAAVFKEVYDLCNKENHTPDLFDAVATILGGASAWIIRLLH